MGDEPIKNMRIEDFTADVLFARPRCGGTPGVFVTTRNALNSVLPATEDCKGCPDCQPAPTPSGDDALTVDEALHEVEAHRHNSGHAPALRVLIAAIRAESAEALRDAHEDAEAWQETAESLERGKLAAEARLREATAEVERLRGVLDTVGSAADAGDLEAVADAILAPAAPTNEVQG